MKNILATTLLLSLIISQLTAQQNPADLLKKTLADWPVADPEEVGMNEDSLRALIGILRNNQPNDFRGLVIIKDNKIIVEEYFNSYWRETIHDIRSAGKSITAMLMGIAIDKGFVKGVDQPILDFFPKQKATNKRSNHYADIRIKHLLMMSSGLDADANDINSKGNELYLLASDDWVEFALNIPSAFKPGERYVYNSVCAMLLGAIIENASGKNLSEFAEEYLFGPLGIRDYYWYAGPGNRVAGMGNLYLRTLDLAKLGVLVSNKGKWKQQQLISQDWITEMSTRRFDIGNQDPFATGYAYCWYISTKEAKGQTFTYLFASGNGGNKLFIVPELDLVVAITSSAYGQGYGHFRAENSLRSILRAIE